MKKKKVNTRRFTIKLLLCMVYMMIINILLVGSYKLFLQKKVIVPWKEVKSTEEYSYIEISKMSEKFAYYENENIGLHFVIEEEETGEWHTYVIAINEDTYKEYKDIIDYSYERTDKVPDKKQVFGYPTIMNSDLKEMILHNINNFLPAENEVEITLDNIDSYLTNSYLDTTKKHKEYFDTLLFLTLLLLFIMVALLIFTIFDRDRIVDNLDDKARKVKTKKKSKKNRR